MHYDKGFSLVDNMGWACLWDSGLRRSLLAPSTLSNLLILGIYPVVSARSYVPMSHPCPYIYSHVSSIHLFSCLIHIHTSILMSHPYPYIYSHVSSISIHLFSCLIHIHTSILMSHPYPYIYPPMPSVSSPVENRSCPESTRCCVRCVIPYG